MTALLTLLLRLHVATERWFMALIDRPARPVAPPPDDFTRAIRERGHIHENRIR